MQLVNDNINIEISGITATSASNFIQITRQPVHDIDAVYHNWDSAFGSDTSKKYDSDGNAILTDWNVSGDGVTPDNSETKYNISIALEGFNQQDAFTDVATYESVNMVVTVSGVQFGTADPTPELDLLNFLTLVSE